MHLCIFSANFVHIMVFSLLFKEIKKKEINFTLDLFLKTLPFLMFLIFCRESYCDKRRTLHIAHWETVGGDKMSLSDKAEETGKQKPDGESDESAQIYRFLGPKIVHF